MSFTQNSLSIDVHFTDSVSKLKVLLSYRNGLIIFFLVGFKQNRKTTSQPVNPPLPRALIFRRYRWPSKQESKKLVNGREPWSSGYGSRLTFQRSWVRIPAPDTGWTFFTLICCKNCIVCLKRPKINKKEAGVGPIFKKLVNTSRGYNMEWVNWGLNIPLSVGIWLDNCF